MQAWVKKHNSAFYCIDNYIKKDNKNYNLKSYKMDTSFDKYTNFRIIYYNIKISRQVFFSNIALSSNEYNNFIRKTKIEKLSKYE